MTGGCAVEAKRELIDTLSTAIDRVGDAAQDCWRREANVALPCFEEMQANRASRTEGESIHVLFDAMLCGGDELGCGRGSGGAQVGDKSAMVKSVSWPMAETTGSSEAAMMRARASLLKLARSSMEPPPRAMTMRSTSPGLRLNQRIAAATEPALEGPCMTAG